MPVTASTAIAFLNAEGIVFEQSRGLILIEAVELERAAAEAATRARRQRVQQALLLKMGIIVSGLAAASLVPRLLQTS